MSSLETTHATDTPELRHPKVRVSVRDFGPVAEGDVELRPLTVFVGPSNTGKTYLAILIYALHRVFRGFPRLPLLSDFPFSSFDLPFILHRNTSAIEQSVSDKDLRVVLDKLNTKGRAFKFSDLPRSLRKAMESSLNDPGIFGAAIRSEIRRCFDAESVSEMVRGPSRHHTAISLAVHDEGNNLWQLDMDASAKEETLKGRIEDMVLLRGGQEPDGSPTGRRFTRFRKLARIERTSPAEIERINPFVLHELLQLVTGRHANTPPGDVFYLPAVRGGIMQSHRVIASALVARSTRAGFERIPQIPTFSGGVADFMQRLILYEEDETASEHLAETAAALERETLAGRILTVRAAAGGYPEFVYRPRGTQQDIRLTRASSMVSELAPVVLFLRGVVSPGDTFIIEEPEAHLHPAAQTQMARCLARLVRAGVRVVVTTHSDWLLQEVANLMREGEIGGGSGEPSNGDSLPSWLRPSEVGIWLFSREAESAGSRVQEIPFDRVEGVEPKDYEEVSEALYNRSAELQNRLAESERRGRDHRE